MNKFEFFALSIDIRSRQINYIQNRPVEAKSYLFKYIYRFKVVVTLHDSIALLLSRKNLKFYT